MPLTFESRVIDEVAVIRCRGRITFGAECEALEAEVDRQTKISGTNLYHIKEVVLHLGETEHLDSAGLRVLVSLHSEHRSGRWAEAVSDVAERFQGHARRPVLSFEQCRILGLHQAVLMFRRRFGEGQQAIGIDLRSGDDCGANRPRHD